MRLLIGIALKEGAIRSIDDLAETYVSGLRDTEYGRTPIKALLLMASGVAFSEEYANPSSDIYTLARLTLQQIPSAASPPSSGSTPVVRLLAFAFRYSSAELLVLRPCARGGD